MDYLNVKIFVLETLKRGLSPGLSYHNFKHTLDVLESAERLCKMEKINGADLDMVRTAALYHDTGFLKAYEDNEVLATQFAAETLPEFNYSQEHIDTICEIIMATQMPQFPKTHLAMVLCDADLDYLGRDDFFPIALSLHKEWRHYYNRQTDFLEWYRIQYEFVNKHNYFTHSARKLRNERKEKNLTQIRKLLGIVDDLGNTSIEYEAQQKNTKL